MGKKLNGSGSSKAGSLVSSGRIKDSDSWNPPSADKENEFLKSHSNAEFGAWHLGVDSEEDAENKGRWSFIFTSDFEKVDLSGLRACITRAAQSGYSDIENRARSLYEKAKKKLGKEDKQDAPQWLSVWNEGETTEMVISGPIGASWYDDSGTTSKEFRERFGIVPKGKKINVRINSEGGSVADALEMYNIMQERKDDVTTFNAGYALSSASILLVAGGRVVAPHSSITMAHEPWTMTVGDEETHRRNAEMLSKHGDTIASIYAKKTGKPISEMRDMMRSETWFTGAEAFAFGLSDAMSEHSACPHCGHDQCKSCEATNGDLECCECGETSPVKEWEEEEEGELLEGRFKSLDLAKFRHVPQAVWNMVKKIPTPPSGGNQNKPGKPGASNRMDKAKILAALKQRGVNLAEDASEDQILEAWNKLIQPPKDPPADTSGADDHSNDSAEVKALREQLEGERRIRVSAEVKRRGENKIENKNLKWWTDLAMKDEPGTLAQIDALPISRPGGEPLGLGISTVENRLEEIRNERSPIKRYHTLKAEWDGLIADALTRDNRMGLAQMTQAAGGGQRFYPVANNTYSASLVTQFLLDGAVTKLQNRWAPLKVFTRDYSQDRYKPRATGQLKFVTVGSTVQTNATNFESGDATVSNVQIAVSQYTSAFHVTNDELNSGLRMENLIEINTAQLADKILAVAFSPLATASFTTNAAIIRAAAAFSFSDMATAWGELKKSPIKYAVLDGEYMARIINQPVFYQATGTESGGEDGWKRFGWDGVYLNTNWTGTHAGANDQNIRGLFCNPQVLGAIAGLPLTPPAIPGATLQESTITVPDVNVSVAAYSWFSLASRTMWMSYDLMFGSQLLDESAGVLLTSA